MLLVQVEGENAANLQQIEDTGNSISVLGDPFQEGSVDYEVAIPAIAKIDHEDVGIDHCQARLRVHRIASFHVL